MKLTLIKPNIGRMEHSLYVDEARMEPLNLGVLAGADARRTSTSSCTTTAWSRSPIDEPTDLVAITVETYTARRSYEIAAEYRAARRAGHHGRLPADLRARRVRGARRLDLHRRRRVAWATVVEDARRGALKPRYQATPGRPQTGVLTRRDLFKGKGYLPITLMQFSRGCRFACDFCAVTHYFDRKHYLRAIDEALQEIADAEHRLLVLRGRQHPLQPRGAQGALPRAHPACGSTGSARPRST